MDRFSLEPINITTAEFLSAFFEPAETVCFRVFSDKADSAFAGAKLEAEQGHYDKIADILKQHNDAGRGIYFVINHGGHEDAQIKRVNAQFMECDNIPIEAQLEKIAAFPLEPSLIVKTRKSLHCYWLIKNGAVERFRYIQRGLIAHFNADPMCVNESRVFRLPGFYHHKEEPIMVDVIKFAPELRYTQEELAVVLPIIDDNNPPSTHTDPTAAPIRDRGSQKGIKLLSLKCPFMKHCKKAAKTLPEPLWYAMISNLALFEGGADVIHTMSKTYPKYTVEATDAKINHFHKSGTKPITCKRIAEQGFRCPNLDECHVKSPAGLAFIPLDMDTLRKLLAKCEPTINMMDNVVIAREYINNYLYNLDSGFISTFINSEIKAKFGFKADELKQLITFQKELYRAFASTQEARRERQSGEIPAWYEVSERGKWTFLPGVLADHLAEHDSVIYCADSYYFYERGVYLPKNDLIAEGRVRSLMNSRYATMRDISDTAAQWKILAYRTVREINVNPYILNFSNGLYNILTDEFSPHDPKILSTIRLGGNYDPAAKCPIFMGYLSDVLPESEIPLIQEILGYMLVPVNKAQKSFVIVGKGDSGKSTFLSVVQDVLLGADNVSTLTWQALDEKFATVQLFGKLANVFADLPSENIRDTGTFKAITGEDYISAQHKFKEYFSFKPFARLLFSCNSVPKSYTDRSDGFYRRLILIRFDQSIPESKRDPNLKEKLAQEADGILAWALDGLRRLIEGNYRFTETARTKAELASYKMANSSVLAFIEECCELAGNAETLSMDLYNAYQEYCSSNGQKSVSQIRFNQDLDGIGGVSRSQEAVTHRKAWLGIRLS